jgi:uncharacterized protein YukE
MSKKDEYVAKIKQQLDDLNTQIDKLEAKALEAKGDALKKYKEQMGNLRKQSQEVQDKLAEIKAATEDTWEGLVAETEKIWDAFKHSFEYFKSQL